MSKVTQKIEITRPINKKKDNITQTQKYMRNRKHFCPIDDKYTLPEKN